MRVLFLSQIVPYPPHGGVLQRGYNLIRELSSWEQVHLLAFVHPDQLRTREAIAESRRVLREHCESVDYFPLWPKRSRGHRLAALALSGCSSLPFSVIAHRSAAFARRVREILAASRFDVVHADTLALAPFVDHGVAPSVLTHHNIESRLMERRADAQRNPLAKAYLRREARKLATCERAVAGRFDVNVVVSNEDRAVLTSMVSGLRIAVVPNGVDINYFTPALQDEAGGDALVYTGGMNMFANRDAVMHFLTHIWPLIAARRPGTAFYAVGQDPPAALVSLAARDRRVVVTGYLDDVRPVVRHAGVYVVPLRVGGGTRLKVLDAMAMGKAIVSTSIGCEGIDVRDGEHLVVADSPTRFADSVVELLADPARRLRLGRAARTLVETRYSWPLAANLLRQAYAAAVDARRRIP